MFKLFLTALILVGFTRFAAASEVNYFSNYHNNAIYSYYPKLDKGEQLTRDEALSRRVYFRESYEKGGLVRVTTFSSGEAVSYSLLTSDGLAFKSWSIHSECSYENSPREITKKCEYVDGGFSNVTYLYVNDLVAKILYLDRKDEVYEYGIPNYIDWVEYRFNPSGKFLRVEELMKSGM